MKILDKVYIYTHLINEIPTFLHNSLNPRP